MFHSASIIRLRIDFRATWCGGTDCCYAKALRLRGCGGRRLHPVRRRLPWDRLDLGHYDSERRR